jgi:hypothetical protein
MELLFVKSKGCSRIRNVLRAFVNENKEEDSSEKNAPTGEFFNS